MTSPIRCTLAAFVSALTCLAALPAAAQSVESFYKSHELTILIGHPKPRTPASPRLWSLV